MIQKCSSFELFARLWKFFLLHLLRNLFQLLDLLIRNIHLNNIICHIHDIICNHKCLLRHLTDLLDLIMQVMKYLQLRQTHFKVIYIVARMRMKCIILVIIRCLDKFMHSPLKGDDPIPYIDLHIFIMKIRCKFTQKNL